MSRLSFGAAKDVLQNSKPTVPELEALCEVLELGCLAPKLIGVGGVSAPEPYQTDPN
jgi:hypothetical protein